MSANRNKLPIELVDAEFEDYRIIAQIHASSWKTHYRGMVSDHYLDNTVDQDRLDVWLKRMSEDDTNRSVILAKQKDFTCGFACTFLDFDPKYGALMDNLHVLSPYQGQGIGRILMQKSAQWVRQNRPGQSLYLWVLLQNEAATKFYERLGGHLVETVQQIVPGGTKAPISRYVWKDPGVLI